MGIKITVKNDVRAQSPENGKDFKLPELQAAVGGLIELVHLPDGRIMVVNDEGVILRMEVNTIASVIARQVICGNVLLIEASEIE